MPKSEKTALQYAVDLLARQEQSTARLREKLVRKGYEEEEIDAAIARLEEKLVRKGYEEEEIDAAIARLEEKHYLDDVGACARQFDFLYNESRSSVRQIMRKLQQRGFDRSLIRDCIPPDTYEREKAAALRVLQLKYKRTADPRKMMANLCQKGFDLDAARAAVEAYAEEADIE